MPTPNEGLNPEAHKLQRHNAIPHGQVHRPNAPAAPYVHRPYPSVRYHPNGAKLEVHDAEEDAALGPEWKDLPFPKSAQTGQVEKAAAAPATVAVEEHLRLRDAHQDLLDEHKIVVNDLRTLTKDHLELQEKHDDLQKANEALMAQLAAAAKKKGKADDTPAKPE